MMMLLQVLVKSLKFPSAFHIGKDYGSESVVVLSDESKSILALMDA